jgi:hypothetical protein
VLTRPAIGSGHFTVQPTAGDGAIIIIDGVGRDIERAGLHLWEPSRFAHRIVWDAGTRAPALLRRARSSSIDAVERWVADATRVERRVRDHFGWNGAAVAIALPRERRRNRANVLWRLEDGQCRFVKHMRHDELPDAEVRALEIVAALPGLPFAVPRLIEHHAEDGWRSIAMDTMSAEGARPQRVRWSTCLGLSLALGNATPGASTSVGEVAGWCREPGLVELVDRLGIADAVVAAGPSHGDLAPWNLRRYGDHTILYDWEFFRLGTPRATDYVTTFCLRGFYRRRGSTAAIATQLRAEAAAHGISATELFASALAAGAVQRSAWLDESFGSLVREAARSWW